MIHVTLVEEVRTFAAAAAAAAATTAFALHCTAATDDGDGDGDDEYRDGRSPHLGSRRLLSNPQVGSK